MKFFKRYRSEVARKRLSKAEKRRTITVKVCRPLSAKSIGLLATPASEAQYVKLCATVKSWQAKGKEIGLLAWFDSHKIPDWAVAPPEGVLNFCQTDIGFFLAPTHAAVLDFEKRPFDILLNTDTTGCLSLLYVVVRSAASFRAGFSDDGLYANDFTLITDPSSEKENQAEDLIHYLNQLNLT